jgi:hypothetical protein
MNKLWIFIKNFALKNRLLLVGAVAIIILFYTNKYNYNRYKEAKEETEIAKTNLKAAQDTIRVIKRDDGSLEYNKLAFITKSLKDLQETNASLYQEVKKMKGQIEFIEKIDATIIHDTVPLIVKAELQDSTIYTNSSFDTTYSKGNYRSLAFITTYNLYTKKAFGIITKDQIGFTATTGIKKTNNGYEIFVNPKYPSMQITSLEGAIIDKNFFANKIEKQKPHLITAGLSIGWVPAVYEFNNKKFDINLQRVGVLAGINFNINRILGK